MTVETHVRVTGQIEYAEKQALVGSGNIQQDGVWQAVRDLEAVGKVKLRPRSPLLPLCRPYSSSEYEMNNQTPFGVPETLAPDLDGGA